MPVEPEAPEHRPTRMRLILGVLLVLAVLVGGCAADTGEKVDDPTPVRGPVAFESLAVVSETAVGGTVDPLAVDLGDRAAFVGFVAQFDGSRMEEKLRAEIESAQVAAGQVLVGAVVGAGCLPPTGLVVENTERGLTVSGIPDKREATIECFAPVTSVAVVAVDASLL